MEVNVSESFDEEMDVLVGRDKGKASKKGKIGGGGGQRPRRYLAGAPEVMVKITGWGHSIGGLEGAKGNKVRSIEAHLKYITRHSKLEAETSDGMTISDAAGLKDYMERVYHKEGKAPAKNRESLHVVLSMPSGTEPEAVRAGAREFLMNRFGDNHRFIFVLHTDTDNPHVHAVVQNRGFDGRKLHYEKGELQKMRQEFADSMNEQGVFADATPRSVRGVIEKSAIQSWLHMLKGDDKRTPRMPKKLGMQIADAVNNPDRPKPWLAAIYTRQEEIRGGLAREIEALRVSGEKGGLRKADLIERFLNAMPPIRTQDERIREQQANRNVDEIDQQQLF